jgi:hypothetical protein
VAGRPKLGIFDATLTDLAQVVGIGWGSLTRLSCFSSLLEVSFSSFLLFTPCFVSSVSPLVSCGPLSTFCLCVKACEKKTKTHGSLGSTLYGMVDEGCKEVSRWRLTRCGFLSNSGEKMGQRNGEVFLG